MFIKQFGIDVGENWVKTQCVQPKWSFLQMMKCNQRQYHNYIEFFIIWTQIFVVVMFFQTQGNARNHLNEDL
jgi:hypothetical protein